MELSRIVGDIKRKKSPPEPIFHPGRERSRLEKARALGSKLGLNPNFAQALLYLVIGESCKQQTIRLQEYERKPLPDIDDQGKLARMLRDELLALTEYVAPLYDEQFDQDRFALRVCRDFEEAIIGHEVAKLSSRELGIDLGCATGMQTFKLVRQLRFSRAIGYDVSPHMIDQARKKICAAESSAIQFELADLDSGIPLGENSTSFVVMNLGTGSELREI